MRLPPQATPDRLLQSAPADQGSAAPAGGLDRARAGQMRLASAQALQHWCVDGPRARADAGEQVTASGNYR